MRRFTMVFTLTLVAMLATPASANHELALLHQPPTAVSSDFDAALITVVVSTCPPACSAVEIAIHRRRPDGSTAVEVATTQELMPGGAVAFVVPAHEIAPPELSYWIEATQRRCIFSFDCHTHRVRAPASGNYAVPVSG